MADVAGQQQGGGAGHHFLLVTNGIQSHVNPGRALARRLARLDAGDGRPVLATLSLPLFVHRRMFPAAGAAAGEEGEVEEEATDGVVSYVPYSDGFGDRAVRMGGEERARSRRATAASLSATLAGLAARRRPVTCAICVMSLCLPALIDAAREHGVPVAVYWIQPATVLAAYYHWFHGYGELIASHAGDPSYEVSLPGQRRPLRIRDMPSYVVDPNPSELTKIVLDEAFRELFRHMDETKTKVLVNTFDELEAAALAAMRPHLDVFAVGGAVEETGPTPSSAAEPRRIHLFEHAAADEERYMEWLGEQPERSVVYVSFGSVLTCSERQVEEILRGLRQCRRPHLLAVRDGGGGDGRQAQEGDARRRLGLDGGVEVEHRHGMVVGWCDQPKVLAHPAVGCFVTHCGWNSTLEAVALGVPVVAAPAQLEQPTNAYLVEEWGAGVRAERDSEGFLPAAELARCVELVMGDGERGVAIRERAAALKEEMARAAAAEGGLRSFVDMAVQANSGGIRANNTTRNVEKSMDSEGLS